MFDSACRRTFMYESIIMNVSQSKKFAESRKPFVVRMLSGTGGGWSRRSQSLADVRSTIQLCQIPARSWLECFNGLFGGPASFQDTCFHRMAGQMRLGSGGKDRGKCGFEPFIISFLIDMDDVCSLGSIRGTIYPSIVLTDNLYRH
jgi:hypothetical protein